jgi:nitrous oxidase accessory protein NosD
LARKPHLLNSLAIAATLIALLVILAPIPPIPPIGPIQLPPLDGGANRPRCDVVVATDGHDNVAGTAAAPFRSSNRGVTALRDGQTLCFRSGAYATGRGLRITAAHATVRSFPSEHATLRGSLRIERKATGTTVEGLTLDGRNKRNYFNPIIYADDAVLRDNEITNEHTTNCVHVARYFDAPPPKGVVIEDNNIHDCGRLPSHNQQHGVYIAAARDLTIRNNLIWDNADRGIQLYTNVRRTHIYGNVIDDNGEGVIISGAGGKTTSDTLIEHNMITNSNIRHNVESFYPPGTPPGKNNLVTGNCIYGAPAPYAGPDGSGIGEQEGFVARDNVIADPGYADPAQGDFRIPPDSPCAGVFTGGDGPPSVSR